MRDIMGMMGKVKEMQAKMEKMQAEIASLEVEGKSGGGLCYGYKVVKQSDARGEPVRGDREIEQLAVQRALVVELAQLGRGRFLQLGEVSCGDRHERPSAGAAVATVRALDARATDTESLAPSQQTGQPAGRSRLRVL